MLLCAHVLFFFFSLDFRSFYYYFFKFRNSGLLSRIRKSGIHPPLSLSLSLFPFDVACFYISLISVFVLLV